MSKLIFSTLQFIVKHPLNKQQKLHAIKNWFKWQIGSRLVPGPVAVPFVNNAKLLVYPGMTGATGNIYTGLHEFEEMSFLLHLLRNKDLFIDVGANIGSYTVLASAVVGAKSISIEPIPSTYMNLIQNININGIQDLVTPLNIGVGSEEGNLRFTTNMDTMNRVVSRSEVSSHSTITVHVIPLDSIINDLYPKLIKIDVEGFETRVIEGAGKILTDKTLDAVIMEINENSKTYGLDSFGVHKKMLSFGFKPYRYVPFHRKLNKLDEDRPGTGNTLYIRNVDYVESQIRSAPAFKVGRRNI